MKETYSQCYWDNLDSITIITKYNSEYTYKKEFQGNPNLVKISQINRDNGQRWVIYVAMTDNEGIKHIQDEVKGGHYPRFSIITNSYREVPDYIFKRAFQSIYNEMFLQFSLNGDNDQLEYLKALFTL